VLGVLPGVLGAIQATEAIKLILGVGEPLLGRLLVYDALELSFREFTFERLRDCAVCGDHPTITEPRDPPGVCSVEESARIRRLRVDELRALLDRDSPGDARAGATRGADGLTGDGRVMLVDVREPREFASGHLDGAVNIPLAELSDRLREIPVDATPVFICRSGARSLTACGIALRAGRSGACNLDGGMLAWSE
jgi:adenylyltransferase/sulfurtransferase